VIWRGIAREPGIEYFTQIGSGARGLAPWGLPVNSSEGEFVTDDTRDSPLSQGQSPSEPAGGPDTTKKHSLTELCGLGAEVWRGIDAQEYVREERASWDRELIVDRETAVPAESAEKQYMDCDRRDKQSFQSIVAESREKRNLLDADSPVRIAIDDQLFVQLETLIENLSVDELRAYAHWPPYLRIGHLDGPIIHMLDDDVRRVLGKTATANQQDVVRFLSAQDSRGWYAGLFEVWVKSRLIAQGYDVSFDAVLPNGRNTDALIVLNGRRLRIECTVLTEDDESRAVFDRFFQESQNSPPAALMRPGPYCPLHARGPSPYYDARRFYAKAFDKIAAGLNPDKSQFAKDDVNLLFVSFAGAGVSSSSPGYQWAIDHLTISPPVSSNAGTESLIPDVSLRGWLDFEMNRLIEADNMSTDNFAERFERLVDMPRRVSGFVLFENCALFKARMNYNSLDSCSITHAEMAELENAFRESPSYC